MTPARTAQQKPQSADAQSAEAPGDDESAASATLFVGDTGTLDLDTRLALVKLLRGPFLDGSREPARWAALRRSEVSVRRYLSEIFLLLVIDEVERIAFTQQASESDAVIPSVLRQVPLTMIDSALVLFLRGQLSAVAGTGQRAIVGYDDIVAQLTPYRREGTTDESAHLKRMNGAVRKMIDAGVLANTSTEGRYEISPVLRILFPAEQIAALTDAYEALRGADATDARLDLPDEAPDEHQSAEHQSTETRNDDTDTASAEETA
ncbi:DUF4194 domain-containing protein [Marisediminicola antarctica]|uniref:DUF4194 domain-containing protein n=1 Tax=Marisediminicola antarctica TaxID=674079 RepID=A0A7L5AEV7_9MICO|nr:DUF4194 domain-containing protein [Marisediminicola antarctica]QHO68940.1 hypothetical protein BHD05_04085 [Marisediminicola antarctica]